MKVLILYVFHELNHRVSFFLRNGLLQDDNYRFVIISNGCKEIENLNFMNEYSNVFLFMRENIGHDFRGWNEALFLPESAFSQKVIRSNSVQSLESLTDEDDYHYKNYDKFIFINSTVSGPHLPYYVKDNWIDSFLYRLEGNVGILGISANFMSGNTSKKCDGYHESLMKIISWEYNIQASDLVHIQSMCYALSKNALKELVSFNFFSKQRQFNYDKHSLIVKCEIGMSTILRFKGYDLFSFLIPQGLITPNRVDDTNNLFANWIAHDRLYPAPVLESIFCKDTQYSSNLGINTYQKYSELNRRSKNDKLSSVSLYNPKDPYSVFIDGYGLEIGGPSTVFSNSKIYEKVRCLDNVVFSLNTVWKSYGSDHSYNFFENKTGKVFEMDGSDISKLESHSYDFILSSHNLEHIANPLKAMKGWINVVKKEGYILLVLPNKNECFDHRREYTKFSILKDKFDRNVGEDNLDSLPEILRLHDLSMDPPAGNLEQFTKRSLNNFENRCLHHHVFDLNLVTDMCNFLEIKLIYHEIKGFNMFFLIQI